MNGLKYVPKELRKQVMEMDPKIRKELIKVYREYPDSRGGSFAVNSPKPGSRRYPYLRKHYYSWYCQDG